jgi:hypothetical protein
MLQGTVWKSQQEGREKYVDIENTQTTWTSQTHPSACLSESTSLPIHLPKPLHRTLANFCVVANVVVTKTIIQGRG